MAGGNFTVENKVRPGAYINFVSKGSKGSNMSEKGIVTMPLVMKWGKTKEIISVDAGSDFVKTFGYDLYHTEMILVKEALKKSNKVLVYRVCGGAKAVITQGNLTITAVCEGSRGNDITIKVAENPDVEGSYVVTTYLDKVEMDMQIAKTIEALKSNDFVIFSGTGELTASAGIVLAGGSDQEASSGDYSDYFAKLELSEFNTIALPVADTVIKGAAISFVKRMRDTEGKKVQAVLSDYPIADYEGIISVKNGVILSDGTVIDKVKATAYTADLTAGANVNKSNTYASYDEAVDVDVKYTSNQIIEALNSGEVVFVPKDGKVVIEQDINTLTSFIPEKGKEFRKNRVIRVLDEIGNSIKKVFEDRYIGKADNNEDGRLLFKGDIIDYFKTLQSINAIQNFDGNADVEVLQGSESDNVIVNVVVQPVDSMEKLYMTVNLI